MAEPYKLMPVPVSSANNSNPCCEKSASLHLEAGTRHISQMSLEEKNVSLEHPYDEKSK